MKWLALSWMLQLGVLPFGSFAAYTEAPSVQPIVVENNFYATLGVRATISKYGFIGGSVETQMFPDGWSFLPNQSLYRFTAGLRFRAFEIGWVHFCDHPTVPFFYVHSPTLTMDAAYDDFYVRITGGAKWQTE